MNTLNLAMNKARDRVILGVADPLARRAISAQFEDEPGFAVIAGTADPHELLELGRHYRPELIVIDSGPGSGGLELCRSFLDSIPEAKVLMLESDADGERELAALWGGASGVVSRDVGVEGIVEASRQVLTGRMPHSDGAMRLMLERMQSMPESGVGMRPVHSPLTSREWEVLDLLTHGRDTEQIARELFLSPSTVRSHIKNLFRKLDVHTREEAVQRGQKLRWPEQDLDRVA